ncbi:MAG: hypothetical protein EZS28_006868 [Streblomastix strix]|uniref:Uncharacterized protein n=1 Tax=Streblomastix strix TaxID=222440 RepID=A0A5J4WR50_9EUKA|nr:MAG: hypothetical protein EZS28_006868 [Streblomastix strix]
MVKLLKKHNMCVYTRQQQVLGSKISFAGSQIEAQKYGLKYVISSQVFFDKHYKEWLPWDDCTVAEEKKLMIITNESLVENIVCLAPKCYSLYNGNEQNDVIVSLVN